MGSRLFAMAFSASCLFAAVPPADARPAQQEIRRLIARLGDKDYFVRQKAEQDLAKIGFDAVDDLADALDSDDMEIVARATRLLRTIKSTWALPGDPPGVVQALVDYEWQDDANRDARVTQLAGLADHQGAGAVCRVICFDRSLVLAKMAAVRLLESLSSEPVKPELAAAIRGRLAACRRAPAQWVLSWLDAGQDPRALAKFLSNVVGEEDREMLVHLRETSPAIIEGLLQLQIATLRRAHRGAEAAGSVVRLMKLHHGDPAALAKLLQWLTEQKDWAATRLVEDQFRATIAASPELLYLMAEAQALRGDKAAADRSAVAALKLDPDTDDRSLQAHYLAGQTLEERGRHDWAIQEWEHVVRSAPSESPIGLVTAAPSLRNLPRPWARRQGGRYARQGGEDHRRAVSPLEAAGRRGGDFRGRAAGPPAILRGLPLARPRRPGKAAGRARRGLGHGSLRH